MAACLGRRRALIWSDAGGGEIARSAAVLVLAVPVAFLAFKSASGDDGDDGSSNDKDDFEVHPHLSQSPRSPDCHCHPP